MTDETKNNGPQKNAHFPGEPLVFDNLADFAAAVAEVTGIDLDLNSVTDLNTDFLQASEQYLLLNIKEYKKDKGGDLGDAMLFLTEHKVYVYSQEPFPVDALRAFQDVLLKPFGEATVSTFVTLDRIEEGYNQRLSALGNTFRKLEEEFNHDEYIRLGTELDRFSERLDEFRGLLIRLQERRYKYVETQYISFDYGVLIAEVSTLQSRCRRRLATLQALRQNHEMRATEELNQRIIRLNDQVKKLTAITVILMLPTLIASHFGMNFAFMPELRIWWVYPAVIVAQFAIVGVGIYIFRKIDWL